LFVYILLPKTPKPLGLIIKSESNACGTAGIP